MRFFLIIFSVLLLAPSLKAEPERKVEEPDFAFITNNPYTENQYFFQTTLSNFFSVFTDGPLNHKQLKQSLEFDWGFTDRLEGDAYAEFTEYWNEFGTRSADSSGFGDTMFTLRYRFLSEDMDDAPITIAFGPTLTVPTGNFEKGLSSGSFGTGFAFTTGKSWNDLFFYYTSLNYTITPEAKTQTLTSTDVYTQQTIEWGVALGWRPIEKGHIGGGHHDLHVTLEGGGMYDRFKTFGIRTGRPETVDTYMIVPGAKYGYESAGKTFSEIGLGVPIGLNSNSINWGVILQAQFEYGLVKNKSTKFDL